MPNPSSERGRGFIRLRPRKIIPAVVRVCLLVLAALSILYFRQHSMVYHPRAYDARYEHALPPNGIEINYAVATAKYSAYYIPGTEPLPKRLWLAFCGNGSLALDWTTILWGYPQNGDAFLLIDYPGYGKNSGYATIASTCASADAALKVAESAVRIGRRPTCALHHRPFVRRSGGARFRGASLRRACYVGRALHNASRGSGNDFGRMGGAIAHRKL